MKSELKIYEQSLTRLMRVLDSLDKFQSLEKVPEIYR